MYKVKVEGIGPLSYVSKDRDSGHDALKLKAGETAEVEFEERLWVWGSPFNPARCNVIITPIQSSDTTMMERETGVPSSEVGSNAVTPGSCDPHVTSHSSETSARTEK